MNRFLFVVLFLCSGTALSSTTCERGDMESLRKTWQSFRQAALSDSPRKSIGFFRFPLKLLGPFDGDKPMKISRTTFVQNYVEIFRMIPPTNETELFASLKKTTANEHIDKVQFDAEGCALASTTIVRVADYNFGWDARRGWIIRSLFYSDLHFLQQNFKISTVH